MAMQMQQPQPQPESFAAHGPQLAALGRAESRLPAVLRRRSVAAGALAALMLASVFGIGGLRLRGRYQAVQAQFRAVNEYNQSIPGDLAAQADAAASLIRVGAGVLGADHEAVRAAQSTLDAWNALGGDAAPDALYAANLALYHGVDGLYNALRAAGAADERADGLYAAFVSAQATIDRAAAAYNQAADAYNAEAGGFPAGLIARLWGVAEAPRFAPG